MKLKDVLNKYTGGLIVSIAVSDPLQEGQVRDVSFWNTDWDVDGLLKFYEKYPNVSRMYTIPSETGLYLELEKGEEKEDE